MVKLRLSALVAPYLDAIQEKRAAGWRWSDVRESLNLECTDNALMLAVRKNKWKAEQLPLPADQLPLPNSKIKPDKTVDRPLPRAPFQSRSGIIDLDDPKNQV